MKNIIKWDEYLQLFENILNNPSPNPPYDNPDYFNYLKLNHNRQNRWLKKGELNPQLVDIIKGIKEKQSWYLITEPWCGDAAHSVPFIYLLSQINPNIELKIVLRDTEPFMIENYLTNGGKSIPKLVIRDENEKDLHVWGPRPDECQTLYQNLTKNEEDFETIKIALQKWYNEDKGVSIQEEFINMFS
ncbi:MAG: thioredoxin family protein [Brumimicrobium sp.]